MVYDETLRDQKRAVMTGDGSQTLYSAEFDETYHSDRDGALYESMQKHVLSAFRLKGDQETLTILDICFGLGYNTLSTLYHVQKEKLATKIHIISPEIDRGLVESLASFEYPQEFAALKPVIDALSRDLFYEDEQFRIEIVIGDARQTIPRLKEKFDIVYQDAFSPAHNPLLWTREYFVQIREVMKDDGVLTTYSIAADVRMGLHENGFYLFGLSGENIRSWMVASPCQWDSLDWIDMSLKIQRNPHAKSLRDAAFETAQN